MWRNKKVYKNLFNNPSFDYVLISFPLPFWLGHVKLDLIGIDILYFLWLHAASNNSSKYILCVRHAGTP